MKLNTPGKYFLILLVALVPTCYWFFTRYNCNFSKLVGQKVDELNGVEVYHNGGVNNVSGRNISADGYNLGLRYQCVEFVKRYYYEHLGHKMPDSYVHAKEFFNTALKDGELNKQRNLYQFNNPSWHKPMVDDILVFNGHWLNRYGHVAILSAVSDDEVEFIKQNPGPFGNSRERCALRFTDGRWRVGHKLLLGWLRKE